MKNNEGVIRKIPVGALLHSLADLFNMGVEYIDIVGYKGEDYDSISFMFSKGYMIRGKEQNFDTIETDHTVEIKRKLTDEDLNDLI